MGIIFLIQYLLGWLTVKEIYFNSLIGYTFILVLLGQVVRYVSGSVFEEAFSRGYLLKNVAEGLEGYLPKNGSLLVAYLFTSSLFGVLHLFNDHASLISTINLSLLGLLFGWPLIKTGKLHYSIGLHACWNITQNNLFGSANSGKNPVASIFILENKRAALWTGGDFGPEGGLICTIVLSTTLLLLFTHHLLNRRTA